METIAVLDGINPSGSNGGNYSGGSSWFDSAPTYPSSNGLAGYLAAFDGGLGYTVDHVNPSGSSGGNYSGGSTWYPHAPTYPSTNGLAALAASGYDVQQVNPSASGGANYSGGSNWFPGAPTYPSSNGLATVRVRAILHGLISGGVAPDRAVVVARAVVQNGKLVAERACNAAYEAAYVASIAAGYDRQFARAAAARSAGRCMAEDWSALATKA